MEKNNKQSFKYVFIILVYRNVEDLEDCINSIYGKITSPKIIVINSFYDEVSCNKIAQVAKTYNCDFINVENKGYSFGNNVGISYANEHYDYNYVVISNPDITVQKFDDSCITDLDIVAPKIIAANGRMQNPMKVKESYFSEKLIYCGFKWNLSLLLFAGIALNKINRILFMRLHKKLSRVKIYAAHGSFVLIKKNVVDALYPIYDENMFLFAEEDVLAMKAKKAGFSIYYVKDIVIDHKEDGSMKLADFSTNKELKKSNIYFYEKYVRGRC